MTPNGTNITSNIRLIHNFLTGKFLKRVHGIFTTSKNTSAVFLAI